MNKHGEMGLVGVAIAVVVGVIMLSIVWGLVTSSTSYEEATDSAARLQKTPFNITLTTDNPIALVKVENQSGTALAASNYTDYVSSGYLQINDNSTVKGTNYVVKYTYQQVGYVTSSIARTVIGFVAVLFATALMIFAIRGRD